jgi:hypothetical protein
LAEFTHVKIGSVVVGAGGAASIDFNNIPQNYTDLILKLSVRTRNDLGYTIIDGAGFKVNGSLIASASMGTGKQMYGYGTGAGPGNLGGNLYIGVVHGSGSTAGLYTFGDVYITNYSSLTTNKGYSMNAVHEQSSTTPYIFSINNSYNSSTPITSLSLVSGTGVPWEQFSSVTLYGVSGGAKASGGTVTISGGYVYHTFTQSGLFTPYRALSVDYLLVGPGGGTKRCPAYVSQGGSGAGGVISASASFIPKAYSILVGAGTAGDAIGVEPYAGNSWIVGPTTIAYGGGAGTDGAGISGGSGGGGGWTLPAGVGGSGTVGQGNAGGSSYSTGGAGGGGGGAGAAGSNGTSGAGGAGGAGTNSFSTWLTATGTGVSGYIGGGGGGGSTGTAGAGGSGGGGAGNKAAVATNGTANTGGGGGGTADSVGGQLFTGANGGSGLIIIRYPL